MPPVLNDLLSRRACEALLCGAACLLSAVAAAQSVSLAGTLGSQALLVVDGGAPKLVAAGQTHQGIKVMTVSADQVLIEQSGQRRTLRLGETPVNLKDQSTAGRGRHIVLRESEGGHFVTPGQINGRAVQLMVDTGATSVALSVADAERMALDYKNGQLVRMSTANGTTSGYRLKLSSVRIADVEVFDVDAVVLPQAMPYVLLGNSFLGRFQMRRDNNTMTLERRY